MFDRYMNRFITKIRLAFKKKSMTFGFKKNQYLGINSKSGFAQGAFSIAPRKSKTFTFRNVKKGSYRVSIWHHDAFIAKNRKSMIVALDVSDLLTKKAISRRLGVDKISQKHGVFEYIGGGRQVDDAWVQDFYFDVLKDTELFLFSVKPLVDRYLNVEQLTVNPKSSKVTGHINDNPDDVVLNYDQIKSFVDVNLGGLGSCMMIYGDLNPNVIDGSSVWLSSIINSLSKKISVVVLLKDDIKKQNNALLNVNELNVKFIYPNDMGIIGPVSPKLSGNILRALDSLIPSVVGVLTRGFDVALEIQKDKTFDGRRFVYVTDFYKVVNGRNLIVDHKREKLKELILNSDHLLLQTNAIGEYLEKFYDSPIDYTLIPPVVPEDVENRLSTYNIDGKVISIGYAGKIQPDWGIDELFCLADKLIKLGVKVKLYIATSKISKGAGADPKFVPNINRLLKKDYVVLHKDLNRIEAMSLINSVDYVWCYRPSSFEKHTLELSTKLIESVVLNKPSFCFPSVINVDLLGDDYPYYIHDVDCAVDIIVSKNIDVVDLHEFSSKVRTSNSSDIISNNIMARLPVLHSLNSKKLCVAGHDNKFINPFISNLKLNGYDVRVDNWEWGSIANGNTTRDNLEWADVILCEWGLKNAVWYSHNIPATKKLFVRLHAQEVREKARKFGYQIKVENVEKFIFVSDQIRKKAIDLFGWPKSKTIVVPNFVDNYKLNLPSHLKADIGILGIVPQTKRLDRALDVLETLLKLGVDARLHIKGQRPEKLAFMHAPGRIHELEYYNDLYKRIDMSSFLKDRVLFYPWGNDVQLWYKDLSFILSPSDNESFHYALADGVIAGCIPVVWSWQGAKDIYPVNWVVKDNSEAANKIIEYLEMDQKGFQKDLIDNHQFIYNSFGCDKIYPKIKSVLNI